ncbi:ATP binding protein [Purpureocillium lavendulum]|uniref:ATP binding protein n=1 Tax=Purpureocillium lavendulum TaxID=1247861 RepID=A0AB34G146_9HYPO|nr:ATP binding protein [Purpureocillium lavendulum]
MIRDDWESKKAEFEKSISDILGESWTIDINPNQIYAYAIDGYAKESLGSMLAAYVSGAEYQLKYFVEKHGDTARSELNALCPARVLTMDLDTEAKYSYCGPEVSSDGKLVMLFREGNLGTNIDHAVAVDTLAQALNVATTAPSLPMSFVARASIRADYDGDIDKVGERINAALGREVALEPNFEASFAKLTAAGVTDWQHNLGDFTKRYIEAFADWLASNKAAEDEMVREGVNEAVDKGKVAFRIVDEGSMKSSYNECVIEDGVLYLQTVPQYFGTNIHYVAEKLMDQLPSNVPANLCLLVFPLAVGFGLFVDLVLGIAGEPLAVKVVHVHVAVVVVLVIFVLVVAGAPTLLVGRLGRLLLLNVGLLLLATRLLLLPPLLPPPLELLEFLLALVDVLVPHDLASAKALLNLGQAQPHARPQLDQLDRAALDVVLFLFLGTGIAALLGG